MPKQNNSKKETNHLIDGTRKFIKEVNDVIDLRNRIYQIIFDSQTPLGKLFDIVLMLFIIASVITVVLHSVPSIREKYDPFLYSLDWFFTICFLIEYGLRVYSAKNRKTYILGFWGILDFIAVFPSVAALIIIGHPTIQVIRIVRLLRVFKVLRLLRFIAEGYALMRILRASLYKITVFMSFIFVLVILLGSAMYVIESGNPGFESIPNSIYWGIVTITTVGFGDVTPSTALGKFVSSLIMLAGYALIAVPTIIIGSETVNDKHKKQFPCPQCHHQNYYSHKYCSECGNFFLDDEN